MTSGVYQRTPKTIEILRIARRKYYATHKYTQEWCDHISESLKEYYNEHPVNNLNKKHSKATRKKISRSMKEYWDKNPQRRQQRSQTMKSIGKTGGNERSMIQVVRI